MKSSRSRLWDHLDRSIEYLRDRLGGGNDTAVAVAVVVLLRDGRSCARLQHDPDYPAGAAFTEDIQRSLEESWPALAFGVRNP